MNGSTSCSRGSEHHSEYRKVAASVLMLEELGFVVVSRAHHVVSCKANTVEAIKVR